MSSLHLGDESQMTNSSFKVKLFGPIGLNYILAIHFVWNYMAQLEKLNYNKPEEFQSPLITVI